VTEQDSIVEGASTVDVRRFDVFLSYNGDHDRETVERVAVKLKRARLEPWFDDWALTPGRNWQEELAKGLEASSTCAVFVGPHGLGAWEQQELSVALDRAAKDPAFRLFLVLLPGLPEPFDATSLPPFLSTRTWVDLRGGVDGAQAFQSLVNAVKGVPWGAPAIEPSPSVCPYRGLQTFDEEHAEFFFGRDGDVQRLVEKLKGGRFLAVLGPSGSGKSSVVLAGLLPALRRGEVSGSETWAIQTLKPGPDPLTVLAAQLTQLSPGEGMARTLDQMGQDQRTLHLATALAVGAKPNLEYVLWVVDQFEEVFSLCRDEQQRKMFLANLLYAGSVPEGRSVVVLTLRADFYPKCAVHPDLSARIAAHQFLVSPLDNEGLRRAIEEPAHLVGLQFEPGLVETILQDVSGRPGALPLLEHSLLELWERRRGTMLTLEGYRESGGVQGALAKRAEAVYDSFTPEQRAIVRRLLLRLTQPGEGTEDTRRRAAIEELVTRPGEGDAVEGVVRSMSDARLLTAGADEQTGEQFVDVSHEALLKSWPRLRAWIDEDRAGLRVLRRITEASQEWQRSSRDEDLLYRGTRLAEALDWQSKSGASLNAAERDFLTASATLREQGRKEAEERREKELLAAQQLAAARRRTRNLYVGTAVILVIGLLGGALALVQKTAADRSRKVAKADELATAALSSGDPELAVLLAAQAVATAHTPPAVDALRRALAESHLRASIQVAPIGADGEPVFVRSAALSLDGGHLATAADDGQLRIWDMSQKPPKLVQTLVGHTGPISSVAYSPTDPNQLVSASEDGSAIVWDLKSGRPIHPLQADNQIYDAEFSPKGNLVVTAGSDRRARVWDVSTGTLIAMLPRQDAVLWGATFDPANPEVVALASADHTAMAWNWYTGQIVTTFAGHTNVVRSVAFSPDGRLLLTGSADNTARVWDVATGEPTATLFGHTGGVFGTAFSPDGHLVATASADESIRLWDPVTGQELRVLRGHRAGVRSVSFIHEGSLLVTASEDGTARTWSTSTGEVVLRHIDRVLSAAFSSDGKLVATASADGSASVWDAQTGRRINTVSPASEIPKSGPTLHRMSRSAEFSTDGTLLVVSYNEGPPLVWDVTTGRQTTALGTGAEVVNKTTFSPAALGQYLLTAGEDGVAALWDASSGQQLMSFGPTAPVRDAEFSPDGQLVLTACTDGSVHIWDVSGKGEVKVLSVGTGVVRSAVFDLKGERVLTATADGTAIVWDAASGRQLLALPQAARGLLSAVFSPDGRFVVTAGADHTTRVWDASTAEPVATLRGQNGAVTSASFGPEESSRPDALLLVTSSADGTARIYPWESFAPLDDLLLIVPSRVTRQLTSEERKTYLGGS
jgi:WD40 repeat protein/energy-coupling factor transporter ATP-binding protein EcfA2